MTSFSAHHGSEQEFLSSLKFLFFLGQVFHGAGSCPLWTLGVTYLDENLPTKTSSLYVGIYYAFDILGRALGYVGGGSLLEVLLLAWGHHLKLSFLSKKKIKVKAF